MKKQNSLAENLKILLAAWLLVPAYLNLFLAAEDGSKQSGAQYSVKSWDRYWQETQLESKELEEILSVKSCSQTAQTMLGCINAINAMGERYRLALNISNLELVEVRADEVESRLTEKFQLSNWQDFLAENFVNLKNIEFVKYWHQLENQNVASHERSAVIAAGLNGFLSLTKDPHSYLIPLDFYEEMIARSDSASSHAGFLSKRVLGGAFVRKVFQNSPAHVAGLRKGDKILSINGRDVKSLSSAAFNEALKLKSGQRLHLTVNRKSEVKEFEMIKTDQVYENVLSQFANEEQKLGMITIHKFSRDTCLQTQQKLISLKEENLRGLILDLRDNPGGQVDEAACILSLFLPKGTKLFETRYLDITKPSEKYFSEQKQIYTGPLTVLINGGSASASEIVAGALKDLGRAQLVGERSFGKGSFQDGRIWGANNKVAYFQTEGLYYFASGWTPQLVGLEPDLVVAAVEGQTLREEHLYINPVRPDDMWIGPQSLAWMTELGCHSEILYPGDDQQINMAIKALSCENRSSAHDQN